MIIIPFLNGYFIGNINPTFSGPNPYSAHIALPLGSPCEALGLAPGASVRPDQYRMGGPPSRWREALPNTNKWLKKRWFMVDITIVDGGCNGL